METECHPLCLSKLKWVFGLARVTFDFGFGFGFGPLPSANLLPPPPLHNPSYSAHLGLINF